jgi:hypothetical protein
MQIGANYTRLREEIPDHVTIVVAAETQSAEDIIEVVEAGATDIGEDYVQEAAQMRDRLAEKAQAVKWHMIGHRRRRKYDTSRLGNLRATSV